MVHHTVFTEVYHMIELHPETPFNHGIFGRVRPVGIKNSVAKLVLSLVSENGFVAFSP